MTASSDPMSPEDGQADAVAYLEATGTLWANERAERIDTHAARIFLAGDRAWKLKRAVSLGYLDFSTCERRRAALEAELTLNRRTAPLLYIGLRPLRRDANGNFSIDGTGDIVDWLLEMHRFPDEALLARLADEGLLDDGLILSLADRVAAFHRQTEPCADRSGHARILSVIDGNRQSMERYPDILAAPAAARLIARQREIADRFARLLDARAEQGRVRHGHGDLHLANIAVIAGEPVPFDCLEFDPSLATTDLLYDIAFLLMDLWRRGLRRQANIFFNRYLDLSPADEGGAALLPLFLSVRATIRAHALAAQADHDEATVSARDYLTFAAEVLGSVPPSLAAVGGLSGTGKSTIARLIGGEIGRPPGARIVRSDVIRKRLAGLEPESPLPKDAYTKAASQNVYREIDRIAGSVLTAGQSVILDAVFSDSKERDAAEQLARRHSVPFVGFWLEAPIEMLQSRIQGRRNDASDADASVAILQQSYDLGDIGSWHRVDASAQSEEVAARVLSILRQNAARS